MVTSYIGADVDCKMTEFAVERRKRIVRRERVPTDIVSIGRFLNSVPGQKAMVIEECAMAGWLRRNLESKVDRFVVCDPRRNRLVTSDGDKTDAIDAGKLAALLRGGYLREVYHTDDREHLALKESVSLYHDRVDDAVRQINKLRGRCRSHGITIPWGVVSNPLRREFWLKDLKPTSLARQLSILWIGFDAVAQQVKLAKREMLHRSRAYPIIGYWRDLPGIGVVRSTTLFAYLDTPWRFSSPKKLWKYCGVGLKRFASGSDAQGRSRPGKLRLFRRVNRRLKDVVFGGALSAIRQSDNPFARTYRTLVRDGVLASNARHAVARKMLTVMWGMWKTNSRYEESLV
jgi:transposase